jgi:cephalosporin hydroxylase
MIRDRKPNHIVETGVRNGNSSLASLLALEENESGRLHSIDLPGGSVDPLNNEVGWIVPDRYRDNWDLRLGKSQELLPELRTEINKIDLFIHDSEHSHSCMMFEFELAWYWLSKEGVILSDDVNINSAYEVFCEEKQANSGFIEQDFGYIAR